MKNKILGYAIGPIGASALGFITLPLLTWFYSAEDIGRISMLQVVSSFSVLLFCLGLDQAYIREYHEAENKPKLFKQSILPGLVIMLVSFAGLYLIGSEKLSIWLYGMPSQYLTVISIACFILSFISRFLSLILRMQDRAIAYSMSQLVPKLMFVIFVVSTVALGLKKDVFNLITAHALSIFSVFLIFAWNTKREWVAAIPIRLDRKQNKELLRFGLPLMVGGLASWGLNVMDKLFLRTMSTFEELGVYSVAMSIAGVATIFAGIFNTIWAPMVYKWVSEGVDTTIIDQISEHVLAAIYFVIVLSGIFSWVLLYALPDQYAAIRYLITICLIGPLLYTLSETKAVGIAVARRTSFLMFAAVGAMLANLIGNFFLVPVYGALGAGISTSVAFFIFYILRTEFSCYVWRKQPRFKSYCIISIMILFSIMSVELISNDYYYFLVWACLLVFGGFLFRSTIKLAIFEIAKHASKF
jgi:O-antigen/teichoic acid export membrane protein